MFGLARRFLLLILLILSVAVPYLAMSDRVGSVRSKISGFFSSSDQGAAPLVLDPNTGEVLTNAGGLAEGNNALAAGPTRVDLGEILRFDLDPRWIMQRWPRVSSVAGFSSAGRYDGLRVPLVTGTNAYDLAGSLTYYFDKNQQMQRLTFHGYTGDERNLVSMITHHYRLQPEPAAGAGVFVARWNAKPTSALWIRRLPVVSAGNQHQKFEIILELNRPNNYASLSPQFANMLSSAKAHAPQGTSLW
jgi:hypothetical protein